MTQVAFEEETALQFVARLGGVEMARRVHRLGGGPERVAAGSLLLANSPHALQAYRAEIHRLTQESTK